MTVRGTPAGGNDVIAAVESEKDILFDLAKRQMTFSVNDLLQGSALGCLDKKIRID